MADKRRDRVIIWVLGTLATITPFAIDLYLPAFADIARQFNSDITTVSLTVSSYFIGMAIGQVLYGPLLDRFGRKRPLYAGLTVFILASAGCMTSGDINAMIVLRFFQAIGGSVAWVAAVTMVRDFFPVEQSVRIFSLLILIIGVSPLLAPTVGGLIIRVAGWQMVFVVLAAISFLSLLLVWMVLPDGYRPDHSVSLRPGPMLKTYWSVLRDPQFATYTFAGAFGFSTLFIYVAGSPTIFMDIYGVSAQMYGAIFAVLSVGFIGGSQVNVALTRRIPSEIIFRTSLSVLCVAGAVFFLLATMDGLGVYTTLALLFVCLSCVGLLNPNANALALAPFSKNLGSASALMGFTQIGIAAVSSAGVGLLGQRDVTPVAGLILATSLLALLILFAGRRWLAKSNSVAGAG